VDWSKEFGEYQYGDVSETVKTRLGTNDRLIDFEKEMLSPFGLKFRYLTLPAYWGGAAMPEEKPQVLEQAPEKTIFTFGGRTFIYDRWGLRPVKEGQGPDNGQALKQMKGTT
jgi:hypothetical protein